jgi:hypothetical protein
VRIALEGLQWCHLDWRSDVLCGVDGLLYVLDGPHGVSLRCHSTSCNPKSFIGIIFKAVFEGIGWCFPWREELALVDRRGERGGRRGSHALASLGTSLSGTLWLRRFIDVVAPLEFDGKLIEAVTVIVIVAGGVGFRTGTRGRAACVGLNGISIYDCHIIFLRLNSPRCLGFV